MPSLVATTSALARTRCVRTHYVRMHYVRNIKKGQVLTDEGVYNGHFIRDNPCPIFVLLLYLKACVYRLGRINWTDRFLHPSISWLLVAETLIFKLEVSDY